MSKTIAPSPARLQAHDAEVLDMTANWIDQSDSQKGTVTTQHTDPQATLRRIARYLREAFPDTINQPTK